MHWAISVLTVEMENQLEVSMEKASKDCFSVSVAISVKAFIFQDKVWIRVPDDYNGIQMVVKIQHVMFKCC